MFARKVIFTLWVIFFLSINRASSLKCYNCDSTVDIACLDPEKLAGNTAFEKDCDAGDTECATLIGNKKNEASTKAIMRRCTEPGKTDDTMKTEASTIEDVVTPIVRCKTDFCNNHDLDGKIPEDPGHGNGNKTDDKSSSGAVVVGFWVGFTSCLFPIIVR